MPPHESFALAHGVWFENDSLLTGLLRDRLGTADGCQLNSRHRQAVKSLNEGLTATATAPDGVVEAVDSPRSPFCLGVQWHPDNFLRTGEFDHSSKPSSRRAASRPRRRLTSLP